MSKYFTLFLLFTTVAVSLTTATVLNQQSSQNSSSPAPSPLILSPPPPPPPAVSTFSPPPPPPQHSPQEYMQQQQLKNIIDALIGAGDFAGWANILFNPISNSSIPTSTNPAPIPTTATMFVPGNTAISRLSDTATGAYSFDPFIIPYHVLPQRLTFSELQLFKTLTRLPTLLPSKTIVITNNSPSNFTIDDSLITEPDIYTNDAVCVHGIANILDYTIYGAEGQTPPAFLPPPPPLPPLPPADEALTPPPEVVSDSSGGCSVDFLISFVTNVLLQCAVKTLTDFV